MVVVVVVVVVGVVVETASVDLRNRYLIRCPFLSIEGAFVASAGRVKNLSLCGWILERPMMPF